MAARTGKKLICAALILLSACGPQRDRPPTFYYWKTTFALNQTELKAVSVNGVTTIYTRYFDIDIPTGKSTPTPVAVIRTDSLMKRFNIIPVVYIANKSFENRDTAEAAKLATLCLHLINQISQSQSLQINELQFDCDWTVQTRNAYFHFLKKIKTISGKTISATIRLHQVKYPDRTGIPPADAGTLMYYNMGQINAGPSRSIYEPGIAEKYNRYISSYPLPLDIALPVFSWGLQIRNEKVISLIRKMDFQQFENDSNFRPSKKNWWIAKNACFKNGTYFAENDKIKVEKIEKSDLLEMADQINRNSNGKIRNVIFYELDSINLIQYDENIFQKISDHIR
ncbi:MAG: hypothetical protein H7Y27_03230 [Gemmatimonadaceae bacterium]|nr:hypothetical protein [Chitinophagaceae bacterium]